MRLAVRLTPRGGRDRVEGWATDGDGRAFLKARVSAPPVEGEANAALTVLLARTFGVSRSAVRIAGGETARLKQIDIAGLDEAAVTALFGPRPGA
jgi:uncharacterized protein YggU (UPF0235/DUF167 family)